MLACLAGLTLAAPAWLAVDLPQGPIFIILGLLAVANLVAYHERRQRQHDDAPDTLFRHLLLDIAGLSALLFFSGGVTNPLISLLLPPLAIAALTLPGRRVALLGLIAVTAYGTLLFAYLPLRLADPGRATWLHLVGMWATFALSALLLAWLIVRMTGQLRARDAALAAAREQALRDERVLAMGTLAAGAAHELGTPLATMALIAGELARDVRLPAELGEDVAVLRQQLAACKEIVTGLSRRAAAERLERLTGIAAQAADRWLQALRERWQARQPKALSTLRIESPGTAPTLVPDPRLEQALLNLLDNAARAGGEHSPVEIGLSWTVDRLRIAILDAGPGFAPALLARPGLDPQPPHAAGSGVGLLLTRAAIEQLGGHLELSNPEQGGAQAVIDLPRAAEAAAELPHGT